MFGESSACAVNFRWYLCVLCSPRRPALWLFFGSDWADRSTIQVGAQSICTCAVQVADGASQQCTVGLLSSGSADGSLLGPSNTFHGPAARNLPTQNWWTSWQRSLCHDCRVPCNKDPSEFEAADSSNDSWRGQWVCQEYSRRKRFVRRMRIVSTPAVLERNTELSARQTSCRPRVFSFQCCAVGGHSASVDATGRSRTRGLCGNIRTATLLCAAGTVSRWDSHGVRQPRTWPVRSCDCTVATQQRSGVHSGWFDGALHPCQAMLFTYSSGLFTSLSGNRSISIGSIGLLSYSLHWVTFFLSLRPFSLTLKWNDFWKKPPDCFFCSGIVSYFYSIWLCEKRFWFDQAHTALAWLGWPCDAGGAIG